MADVAAASRGGAIFAAGGGGWVEHGLMLGTAAVTIGKPELVSMDEVPDDAWIATAAAIGAPGDATNWEMQGVDYVKAVELLQQRLGARLYGLMIGQNGMSSTMNAWLPAALLGVKVIDAVGDIRAHPTGDMGSIGMARSPETMIQTAVGGHRDSNSYIELVVTGATAKISPVLRTAADMAGGFIASCRNPLRASYVRANAALGGISMALALGEAILAAEKNGGAAIVEAICAQTKGTILSRGKVAKKSVVYTPEAFDIGVIEIAGKAAKDAVNLHVMNEYMAVTKQDGTRLATFPDVITTLDMEGRPISAGRLQVGDEVQVFHIAKAHLPLSSSVKDPSVYPIVEKALGMPIAGYALA
jgi:DUF917 family protein